MAIGITGGSVGMVVLPILFEFLLSEYGFKGAVLIHSAISLNIVMCGLVVFPLPKRTVVKNGTYEFCGCKLSYLIRLEMTYFEMKNSNKTSVPLLFKQTIKSQINIKIKQRKRLWIPVSSNHKLKNLMCTNRISAFKSL